MADTITTLLIQIKGDATQAVAELKSFATGATTASTQVKVLEQNMQKAGATTASFRENVRAFKEPMDSAYYGLMIFGDKIPGLDEGLMGLQSGIMGVHSIMEVFGVELATLAPYIAVVAAAIAGGMYAWHEWNSAAEEAAQKAKDLADAWKQLPDLIKQINDMQQAGLLGPGAANEYLDYALGKKKLYVDENGNVTPQPTHKEKKQQYTVSPDGIMVPQEGTEDIDVPNKEATFAQGSKWLQENLTAGGQVSKEYLDSTRELQEAVKKVNEESLTGIAKQKAEVIDRYDKEREEIEKNLKMARASFSGVNFDNTNTAKAGRLALTQTYINQEQDIAAIQAKADAAHNKAITETLDRLKHQRAEELAAIKRQEQADKEHAAQLQRQAEQTSENARADLEAKIKVIQMDPQSTSAQKLAATIPLQQQLYAMDQQRIDALNKMIDDSTTSDDARLAAQKQLNELVQRQAELNQQITASKNSNNFDYQFSQAFVAEQDEWKGWAIESADSFKKSWDGATSGVADGLTHLFEYGAQRGQWFRTIWNGVIGSMISSTTHMVVDWASKHVIMQGISMAFHAVESALGIARVAEKAAQEETIVTIQGSGASQRIVIRTGEAAHDVAMTGTQTAAHGSGETMKTLATTLGAGLRSVIRAVETATHNTLVALRVAAHVAGEAASTAATAVGAMARAIYHAIAAAVGAMESEASVPYVGVILGIAAGAAILAAAYGLMGGFAEGGYTGDGHPSQIAGIVHAGEYVIPANRVQDSRNLLSAIHSGQVSDSAAPHISAGAMTPPMARTGSQTGNQVQHVTHVAVYHDKAKMAQDLQQSDAHEKWVADISARTASKMRS